MRKLTFVVAALVALVATSYAVANGIEGAKNAKAVAGTFTATASSVSSRTCTTTDNKTIVVTDGKYAGAATGDADLTGPITLRARSVVNTTDGVGTVSGSLRIGVVNGKDTQAAYTAVYDHGNVAGLAAGKAHDPQAKLVANLSAGFAAATGFTSGKLGGGTAGGSAVEVGAGSCKPAQQNTEKSQAHGAISALSASSITVAGLTCAIPADKSADVNAKFKQGDTVQISCAFANGANTLTAIAAKKH
jgi:hypothetical protein